MTSYSLTYSHFPQLLFSAAHPPKTKVAVPRPLSRCFTVPPQSKPVPIPSSFAPPSCPEEELCATASCTLVNRLSSAKIVDLLVRPGSIVCVLDNGVLEAYRFAMSETAKFIVGKHKRDASNSNNSSSTHGEGASNSSNIGGQQHSFIEDSGLGNLISFEDFDQSSPEETNVGTNSGAGSALSMVEELEGRKEDSYSSEHFAVSMIDTPPPKQKNFLAQRRASLLNAASSSSSRDNNYSRNSNGIGGSEGVGDCYRDVLVAVEKEFLHFEQIQRVPLTRSPRAGVRSRASSARGAGAMMVSPQVHCSHSSGLIFCFGRIDGGVRPCICSLTSSVYVYA